MEEEFKEVEVSFYPVYICVIGGCPRAGKPFRVNIEQLTAFLKAGKPAKYYNPIMATCAICKYRLVHKGERKQVIIQVPVPTRPLNHTCTVVGRSIGEYYYVRLQDLSQDSYGTLYVHMDAELTLVGGYIPALMDGIIIYTSGMNLQTRRSGLTNLEIPVRHILPYCRRIYVIE